MAVEADPTWMRLDSRLLQSFEDCGQPLASADAHRFQSVTGVAPLHLAGERGKDAPAGRAYLTKRHGFRPNRTARADIVYQVLPFRVFTPAT
jgi:hypothetical protein